jgi:NAD(P)-dependent dehydrogenase (short-subunit alcohol dehydrogenase family)
MSPAAGDLAALRGRRVVVTGSTRGFGRSLVTRLSELGARVVVAGPFPDEARALADELTAAGGDAVWSPGDVTQEADVQAMLRTAVDSFGGVDVWINNAAYETPGMARVLDFPGETGAVLDRTTAVNVVGTGRCTLVALEHMVGVGRGVIVNVTGRGDDVRPTPFSAPYGASKAWVRAFTRTLRKEYADSGVNLVAFNPGIMTTARMERAHFLEDDPAAAKTEKMLDGVTRVLGDPPEVAAERLIAFLASPRSQKAKDLRLIGPVRIARGLKDEAGRLVAKKRGAAAE